MLKVHTQACEQIDPHLTDFLEEFLLRPISLWIRRLNVIICDTKKAGPTLGTYQLNKHLSYNMQLFFETNKEITGFMEQ